jgi:coenzyme F420-dependent glucose-6-phosphate dehydrogenase
MRQTWPRIPLGGPLATDVPPPQHFERAAQFVTEDMMARAILHGPDPEPYVQRITTYRKAGVTHLHLLQLRPDQRGFPRFYEREIAGSAPAPIHT